MDERKLTVIVVPHGDLETRSFEITYGRLKVVLVGLAIVLLLFVFIVASWFPVAAQAGRVPGLERDVRRLETERAKVAELARTLSQVEAQYERVRQLLGADADPLDSLPSLPPLPVDSTLGTIGNATGANRPDAWPLATSGFITQSASSATGHPGLDIAVPANSNIRAAGAGYVQNTGEDSVYGRYVIINHGGGLESLYGHASKIFVSKGDHVDRLAVIALVGSTGRSTAPHLHFEIRKNGKPVDPLLYVKKP